MAEQKECFILTMDNKGLYVSNTATKEFIQWYQSNQDIWDHIDYINCQNNCGLVTLPPLPKTLTQLHCPKCSLSSLPDLPDSLVYLDCSDNLLAILPELPKTLRNLCCSTNILTTLPSLPEGLEEFYCHSMSTLESMPDLPKSLRVVQLSEDPFKPAFDRLDRWKIHSAITTYMRE